MAANSSMKETMLSQSSLHFLRALQPSTHGSAAQLPLTPYTWFVDRPFISLI